MQVRSIAIVANALAILGFLPPATVDLRPQFEAFGLPPRSQGPRPTCSIFTTCAALEFAIAKARGHGEPMSVEFVNWACNAATNRTDDGDFFHFAIAGYERYGLCPESACAYASAFDPNAKPSAGALQQAAAEKAELESIVKVVWIKPIAADSRGLDAAQFAEVKRVLAGGDPVAAGAGHSRLLVGYRDDVSKPGGGVFITKDSGLGAYGEVDYAFVQHDVCDAFWVEARPPASPRMYAVRVMLPNAEPDPSATPSTLAPLWFDHDANANGLLDADTDKLTLLSDLGWMGALVRGGRVVTDGPRCAADQMFGWIEEKAERRRMTDTSGWSNDASVGFGTTLAGGGRSSFPPVLASDERCAAELPAQFTIHGSWIDGGVDAPDLEPAFKFPWPARTRSPRGPDPAPYEAEFVYRSASREAVAGATGKEVEDELRFEVTTRMPFTGKVFARAGDEQPKLVDHCHSFDLSLPVPQDAVLQSVRIVRVKDAHGLVELRRRDGDAGPQVAIESAVRERNEKTGDPRPGRVRVTWNVDDGESDSRLVRCHATYSPDGGNQVIPVAVSLRSDTGSFAVTLDASVLPPSTNGTLRVFASDGLDTTIAEKTGIGLTR